MADRQLSIKKRVRAVILSASVIVLLVTAAAFVAYEALSFRVRLVRNLSTLAAVIADNSAAPLAFDNRPVAEEILFALRAEPDIDAAALYNRDGKLFATYPASLPANRFPAQIGPSGHEFNDSGVVLFQPVT